MKIFQNEMTAYYQFNDYRKLTDWVEMNKATFDISPDIVFVKDVNFTYHYMNPKFKELYPHVENTKDTITDYEVFPLEMVPQFRATDQEILNTCEVEIYDSQHLKSDKRVYYKTTKSPILVDNEIIGILGIAREITVQVEREKVHTEKLSRALDQFKNLVNHSPLGIVISKKGKILFANESIAQMVKRERDELYDLDPRKLWSEDSLKLILDYIKKRERGEKAPDSYEATLLDKDGNEIPILHRVKQIELPTFEGKVSISYAENISDRKEKEKLQELIYQRDSQKNRTEALGNLASGIAHEINNYMTPILGYTSVLKEELKENHPEYLDYIEPIELASNDISHLTKSILEFAESEMKQIFEETHIHQFIREAKSLFDTITDNIEFDIREDGSVMANKREIRQLVINLIKNAKEALLEIEEEYRSPIKVTNNVEVIDNKDLQSRNFFGNVREGKFAVISVENYGANIDEDIIPKIFDPYFTTKDFGKGMGLAVTMGIVQRHGGMIEIEIQETTKFKVYLPIVENFETRIENIKLNTKRKKDKMEPSGDVLIVEDNENVQKVLSLMMSQLGFSTKITKNRDEALIAIERSYDQIDWIFMDISMPGLSLPYFIDHIKPYNSKRMNPFKIVLNSGHEDSEIIEYVRNNYQPSYYLNKPYDLLQVKEILENN